MKRRVALAAGLALVVVLVLLALRRGDPGGGGAAQVERAPTAVPASGPASSAPGAERAGGASAPVELARARTANEERLQRMRADWCGYGAVEHERETDALLRRIEAAKGSIGMEAIAELNATDGAKVLDEARAQARHRWIAALRQRGDPRSMALAAFLLPGSDVPAEAAAASRARLQSMARSSTDPMITALALQLPCAGGACVNVEASQWSRLEPQNLQAWLVLLKDRPANREDELAYVIERMASQGAYSNTYSREAQRMLLSLPQTESPGLQSEAELQLVAQVAASWSIGRVSTVLRACRRSPGLAGAVERCDAIAQAFWRDGDLSERSQALSLARAVVAVRPALRPGWEGRAREMEAVEAWAQLDSERLMEPPEGRQALTACEWQSKWRHVVRERVAHGEWGYAWKTLRAAGADEAALAAAWRQQSGRGALDPVAAAASAPAGG